MITKVHKTTIHKSQEVCLNYLEWEKYHSGQTISSLPIDQDEFGISLQKDKVFDNSFRSNGFTFPSMTKRANGRIVVPNGYRQTIDAPHGLRSFSFVSQQKSYGSTSTKIEFSIYGNTYKPATTFTVFMEHNQGFLGFICADGHYISTITLTPQNHVLWMADLKYSLFDYSWAE